jgi:septum formation protein
MGPTRLVLASGSPRRRELLVSLGLTFEVEAANVDEAVREGEAPRDYVLRVAREKGAAVARRRPDRLVLAADTTVALGAQILGKPADAAEAAELLRRLSGRRHAVFTAVVLDGVARAERVVETAVSFRELSREEIAWYAGTGEPLDKAGAYAIQGAGGAFVRSIEGSASSVIGLPLAETVELLGQAGHPLPWSAP